MLKEEPFMETSRFLSLRKWDRKDKGNLLPITHARGEGHANEALAYR